MLFSYFINKIQRVIIWNKYFNTYFNIKVSILQYIELQSQYYFRVQFRFGEKFVEY